MGNKIFSSTNGILSMFSKEPVTFTQFLNRKYTKKQKDIWIKFTSPTENEHLFNSNYYMTKWLITIYKQAIQLKLNINPEIQLLVSEIDTDKKWSVLKELLETLEIKLQHDVLQQIIIEKTLFFITI
jgi:hypothetical protein